jgi:hypothetical protein
VKSLIQPRRRYVVVVASNSVFLSLFCNLNQNRHASREYALILELIRSASTCPKRGGTTMEQSQCRSDFPVSLVRWWLHRLPPALPLQAQPRLAPRPCPIIQSIRLRHLRQYSTQGRNANAICRAARATIITASTTNTSAQSERGRHGTAERLFCLSRATKRQRRTASLLRIRDEDVVAVIKALSTP